MDQPGLPHPPVVEGGRVAGPPGELRVPVDPLHDVGDVELVAVEEPGYSLPVLAPRAGAACTPYRPIPMPTCQQIMSVTVKDPLTMGPIPSPSATSSHHRGVGAPGASAGVLRVDLGDLPRRCRARSRWRRTSCVSRALCARCGSSAGTGRTSMVPWSSRKTCAVHSCTARSANSLGLSSTPPAHCGGTLGGRVGAAPTTHGRWPSRRRARPGAGRPASARAARVRPRRTSSSPMRVSPPTSGGGAIGPSQPGARAVVRDRTTEGCRRRRHSAT